MYRTQENCHKKQMGANLCTLRQPCFTKMHGEVTDEDASTEVRESTVELFLDRKLVKSEDEDVKPTLEQWMLASPGIYQDVKDESKMQQQQLCWQYAKVSPVSCESCDPRESFSMSRSSVSGKRVSFKLPEDADFIFYACDDEKEEWEWEL
ncbi:uncharacterized protein A4U43_C01F10880 [Asparagus officinalis]|uniref:Uncharacterized protein n=1 Tax=Asparagus officinalis TaxID=4686 RepID=A0A5P1FNG2_ASPOF|nr:uncharacterized protein A4U43_C01F10880 [Asparagus officinalis]